MASTSRQRLLDRPCLIVGGTGGIGRATAQRFIDEGARTIITGHDPDEVNLASREFGPIGLVSAMTADVTDSAPIDDVITEATERLGGRLDILVHVAGISGRSLGDGPLHECSDAGWSAVLTANATGAFHTNRAAVRQMLTQSLDSHGLRGSIINLGSVLESSPSPRHFGTAAYASSKGALRALTLAAAAQYANDRIRFNLVAPGLIDTPMAKRAVQDAGIQTYLKHKQPLASGPGLPEDVAEAILFLAEPASRFITGIVLPVEGGWSISEGLLSPMDS